MIDESIMLDSIQQQTELNDTSAASKTVDTQQTEMNDAKTELKTVEHEKKLKTINAVSVSETAASHQNDVATCNVPKEKQAETIAPENVEIVGKVVNCYILSQQLSHPSLLNFRKSDSVWRCSNQRV